MSPTRKNVVRRHARTRNRPGLTLIEVIVALLVFSIGGLGLAAGSAAILSQMVRTNLRSHSAASARARDESFHGSTCGAIADGSLTSAGLRSVWRVAPGIVTTLDQTVTRGTAVDTYLSATQCE